MDEQSVEHCLGTPSGLYIRFNRFVLAKSNLRLAPRFLYMKQLQAVTVWRLHVQVLHTRTRHKLHKVMAEYMAGGQHTSCQAASLNSKVFSTNFRASRCMPIPSLFSKNELGVLDCLVTRRQVSVQLLPQRCMPAEAQPSSYKQVGALSCLAHLQLLPQYRLGHGILCLRMCHAFVLVTRQGVILTQHRGASRRRACIWPKADLHDTSTSACMRTHMLCMHDGHAKSAWLCLLEPQHSNPGRSC